MNNYENRGQTNFSEDKENKPLFVSMASELDTEIHLYMAYIKNMISAESWTHYSFIYRCSAFAFALEMHFLK